MIYKEVEQDTSQQQGFGTKVDVRAYTDAYKNLTFADLVDITSLVPASVIQKIMSVFSNLSSVVAKRKQDFDTNINLLKEKGVPEDQIYAYAYKNDPDLLSTSDIKMSIDNVLGQGFSDKLILDGSPEDFFRSLAESFNIKPDHIEPLIKKLVKGFKNE